jgi:hypothetical protein
VRGGWLVGMAGVVVLAYITFNTLRTESVGSRGLAAGSRLPPFAMPLAGSRSDADANIATRPDSGPEVTRSGRCEEQVDVLDRIAPRYPRVRFAAVAVRGDHQRLRRTVRERGWRLPVGYDHDGAVANLYGVAICPTVTFAARGGEVAGTALEFLDERALAARVDALEAGRKLPEAAR